MINVTQRYIEACENSVRTSYIIAKFGLYDNKAKSSINNVIGNNQEFSNTSQVYDEIKDNIINYISCEPNRVKLDGSFAFLQNKNKSNTNQNLGIWSKSMSNENGIFENKPNIEFTFNDLIEFTDLTLYFQEVVKDLDIKYYLNNELIYTRQIRNNNKLSFETIENISTMSIQYFDKLILEFISTKEPYRYIKFNEIDFGVYKTFKKGEISDLEIIDELNIDTSELSSNTCTLTLSDTNGDYDILNPYNKLKNLQEKQVINIYHYLKVGNEYKEIPLGTYLIKNFEYQNKKLKIESYDDIYFMNKTYYGSKFYENENVKNVLKDLFEYFNYSSEKYQIQTDINDTITGYLPSMEFREALRMICESCNLYICKNRYGITKIFKNFGNAIKLFKTNEIEKPNPKKALYNSVIDIYEYSYSENEDNTLLYKDTLQTGTYTIIFKESPIIYKLYKDNFNLLKQDQSNNKYNIVNLYATSCIIEVLEETEVNLVGKIYTINKTSKRFNKNQNNDINDYAISNIDNNFITSKNITNIAEWKLNRKDITYSFECNSMPYIEVGDRCKYQLNYKDLKGNIIKREFIPTSLKFTLGIKETIEGE